MQRNKKIEKLTPEEEAGLPTERARIVDHIRDTATRLLVTAIEHDQYDLEATERIASVMEEVANAIAEGDHWKNSK